MVLLVPHKPHPFGTLE